MAGLDAEKGVEQRSTDQEVDASRASGPRSLRSRIGEYAHSFEKQLAAFNLETRGIKRVESEERHDLKSLGYAQIAILWFSTNLCAVNVTLGMLGPAVYYLSFRDAALCAVFGEILVGRCPILLHVLTLTDPQGLPCSS